MTKQTETKVPAYVAPVVRDVVKATQTLQRAEAKASAAMLDNLAKVAAKLPDNCDGATWNKDVHPALKDAMAKAGLWSEASLPVMLTHYKAACLGMHHAARDGGDAERFGAKDGEGWTAYAKRIAPVLQEAGVTKATGAGRKAEAKPGDNAAPANDAPVPISTPAANAVAERTGAAPQDKRGEVDVDWGSYGFTQPEKVMLTWFLATDERRTAMFAMLANAKAKMDKARGA